MGLDDVGLIEVDRDLTVAQGLNFRDPYVGERVFTFGFPRVPLSREAMLVMQGGEVSAESVKALHGYELFLFSAIARPGNSGGLILSEGGMSSGSLRRSFPNKTRSTNRFTRAFRLRRWRTSSRS